MTWHQVMVPWRAFGSVLRQCQVHISDHKSPQHRFPGQTPSSLYVPERLWAKRSFFLESFFPEPTIVHPRRGNVTWVWSLHPRALHLGRTQGQMSNLPGLAAHTGTLKDTVAQFRPPQQSNSCSRPRLTNALAPCADKTYVYIVLYSIKCSSIMSKKIICLLQLKIFSY